MPVMFLTTWETVTIESYGETEQGETTGPFYEDIRRPVGVDGIGDWQAIDLTVDATGANVAVVWAADITTAPAGTRQFRRGDAITTRQDVDDLMLWFGIVRPRARDLRGLTWGRAIYRLSGVKPAFRNGRRRLCCGPEVLHDGSEGGE